MCVVKRTVSHLTGEVVMQQVVGHVPLHLAHAGGLLQLLREDLVQLHTAPHHDLPLDLGRGLLVPHQQAPLQVALIQLVQLVQEDTALQNHLERKQLSKPIRYQPVN